jgi:hypothetical protein
MSDTKPVPGDWVRFYSDGVMVNESECCCAADQAQHAADCKDCECGLVDAIAFGVEQSGMQLEPPPMTPDEEARFHEAGMKAVEGVLASHRAAQGKER